MEAEKVRQLKASDIAARTGRGVRVVQMWPKQGCPCSYVTDGGVQSPRFNLEEVQAWLRAKGLPATKGKGGPDLAASLGDREAGNDQVENMFATVWRDAHGKVDLQRQIADANLIMRDLRLSAERPCSSAEAQQFAAVLKQISQEIRMLELAVFEKEKRDGEWVRRATARDILTGEAGMFAADLETLGQDLSNAAVDALAAVVAPEQADTVRRLLAVAVRSAVDRIRVRRADAIERAAGMLDHADRVQPSRVEAA